MAATISKIGILVGLDTTGLAGGAAKAETVIGSFGNKIENLGGFGANGEFKLVSSFKAASAGLAAMEGSLAGMGSSMGALVAGGPVLVGIAAEIAALFAAAKFSAWGIQLAMGQDAEFTGKWKVFKDEIADLAVKIGELFMPLIKWWLDVGIAAVRALKGGTIAESGTYDRLTSTDPNKRTKAAFDTLEIEEKLTEEYRRQHKMAEDAIRRRQEDMQRHADAITKSLRTPAEVLQDSLAELNSLMDANMISFGTYSRGIERAADEFANLNDKARQLQQIQSRTINPTALERGSSAELSARNRVESIIQAQADTAKQQLATQQRQEKLEQQIRDILKANNVVYQPVNLR